MKRILILLPLVLNNCNGARIVKRLVNEHNATDDSFHINVSAGYGVHSDNTTFTKSPVYNFQERINQKENTTSSVPQDQISEPSQRLPEVLPSPSYQVHEKSSEIQEKKFQMAKNHRYRSVEKRVRKPINNLAPKENIRQIPELTAGTKIVEVLRVPAMYELHLQSDPQRLVQLNSAWLNKLNWMNQNQYKKPVTQQFYQFAGNKNVQQQPQNLLQQSATFQQPQRIGFDFVQSNTGYNVPNQRQENVFQNSKNRFLNQKAIGHNQQHANSYGLNQPAANSYDLNQPIANSYQPVANSHGLNQQKTTPQVQVQNLAGFKYNYVHPQNLESSHSTPQGSVSAVDNLATKLNPETPTQYSFNNQQLSMEIPSDYYQKPQALHEVPAPVLNKETYKAVIPQVKAASVPSLVYGKPVDPPYQPPTQPPHQSLDVYDGTPQNQNVQVGPGQYSTADVLPNYYQQQKNERLNGFRQDSTVSHYPQHNKQNLFSQVIYRKNPQNYYNDAIGDYLDQTLAMVNGGVATYLNNDGTMTVSNFQHSPKLSPSGDYQIPVNENTETDLPQDYELAKQNDGLYNNQIYSGYNSGIPVTEDNQIETAEFVENHGYGFQNSADLSKLPLVTSRFGTEKTQKYEPVIHRRKYMPKKYSKSYSTRRMEPMDYIVYIKERTFD